MLPKILGKNPKNIKKVYPQAFVAECMGGTSFSWDQRQNRKGIFQFLTNLKGVFLLQMQHSPDCGNRSFRRQLKRVRPGASSRPLDETRS